MTENFQDKLHQEECKQSKGAKICASIRRQHDCEKKMLKNFLANTEHAKSNKCEQFH